MPDRLHWSHANKADVADIQQFQCCGDAKRTPPFGSWKHPQPWAYKAQSLARNCRPCRAPQYLMLGRDSDDRLTAVTRWEESPGSAEVIFQLIAVSIRAQGCGLGAEAMERVLDEITLHAEPHDVEIVQIRAEVHPQNEPSLKLLARSGFQFHTLRNDHQVWALGLDITGVTPPTVIYPD